MCDDVNKRLLTTILKIDDTPIDVTADLLRTISNSISFKDLTLKDMLTQCKQAAFKGQYENQYFIKTEILGEKHYFKEEMIKRGFVITDTKTENVITISWKNVQ